MDTQERIKQQVTGNPVVLYMKGTPQFPQCGFSANAVQILKACGVDQVFTVNVLEEPEIRQGIKEYANWPTIPQLYVNGEFVGGSDIMREMYQSGELHKLLAGEKTTPSRLSHFREQALDHALRLGGIAAAEEIRVVEHVVQVVEDLPDCVVLIERCNFPIGRIESPGKSSE